MSENTPCLKVRGLSFCHQGDNFLFDDLNFDLKRGQIISIVGPSGIGKSSLLRLVSGAQTPDAGLIQIEGILGSSLNSQFAIVQQEYTLFPHLTASENVEMAMRSHEPILKRMRPRTKQMDAETGKHLSQVSMLEHADKRPLQLSGGQRQRVAIAQALAQGASFLLMDEPFGALDEPTRLQLQQLVSSPEIRNSFGILLVTHDIEEALMVSDRIMILGPTPGAPVKFLDTAGLSHGDVNLRNSDAFFKHLTILRDFIFSDQEVPTPQIMDKGLVSEKELSRIEETADIVLVISKELFQELNNPTIQDVQSKNVLNGIRYHYIVPESAKNAIIWLDERVDKYPANVSYTIEDSSKWMFYFGEIVLYQFENGSRLGFTYSGGVTRGTLFRVPEALVYYIFDTMFEAG